MNIKKFIAGVWIDVVSLVIIGIVFVVPFIFIFLTAAKTRQEAALFQFTWPSQFQLLENIREVMVFGDNRMLLALWNSTLLTVGSVTLIVLFSALAFASGTQGTGSSGKKIEIRDMSPHGPGSAFGDHYIATQQKFMKDNPNVTIVHDVLPSAELRTKITVEMAAGNPPHTAWNILSYAREFMRDDKIIDWRPVYEDPKHPEFKKWFTKTVLETPTDDQNRIKFRSRNRQDRIKRAGMRGSAPPPPSATVRRA